MKTVSGRACIGPLGSNSRMWAPKAVNSRGAVSPAARATESNAPVITPGAAAGRTSCSDTRHRGRPRANPDSRRPFGINATAPSVVRVTIGNIKTASATAPEKAEKWWNGTTRNAYAKSPMAIEGVPTRTSLASRTQFDQDATRYSAR